MKKSPQDFGTAVVDLYEEMRYRTPTIYEEYRTKHLSREGARVYALEHCIFAANFPRWLANVAGNCSHLDVRKYLIGNMYVEEVHDPTITIGHYESLVDFAVGLGIDRRFVYAYRGAPITRMRITYCDWASRHLPWLEAFAAIAGDEISRGTEMIKRVGERALTSRRQWAALQLPDNALTHWDAAEEADTHEGGHGDVPLEILKQYADTAEKQEAVLRTIRERWEVNRIWWDQIGVWAFEASGLTPPPIRDRQPVPAIVVAA